MTEHHILGIMSGSSLDGIDFAVCRFLLDREAGNPITEWSILAAETDNYPPAWRARLRSAVGLPARETWRLHADLGKWFGQRAAKFLARYPELKPTLAGCHGHTLFHDPARGYSVQLGDGASMANLLEIPVVTDLRNADIAAGGQGAPLAPVADRYLFPGHTAFLNLGGIANFSIRLADDVIVAGDVSGCCQILDRLAAEKNLPYDAGGQLARSGKFLPALAGDLGRLTYHAAPYPKSLGNDWVVNELWPLVNNHPASTEDRLHTFCKWLAHRISTDMVNLLGGYEKAGKGSASEVGAMQVTVSGGGAHNDFLLELLNLAGTDDPIFTFVAADGQTSDFKEAALIALCALLRQQELPNSFATATGARTDTVNGALYLPSQQPQLAVV